MYAIATSIVTATRTATMNATTPATMLAVPEVESACIDSYMQPNFVLFSSLPSVELGEDNVDVVSDSDVGKGGEGLVRLDGELK